VRLDESRAAFVRGGDAVAVSLDGGASSLTGRMAEVERVLGQGRTTFS